MTSAGTNGLETALLLEQVSWIRRLARELVADHELAEDLVQETCVTALEHRPREAAKLRPWLAQVLRNALRQYARAQGRRGARERAGARPEAVESAGELVLRVALQRELVGAVLELDEPYRSTVLLRYFEELPPREIARRTGVPVDTVQSRLARALARLRERLDHRHGAFPALLLSWARAADPLEPPNLIALLMNAKLLLTAAVAVVCAGAIVWWNASDAPPRAALPGSPAEAAHSAPATPGPAPLDDGPERSAGAREALASAARPAVPAPASAKSPSWTARLRVLDAEAAPMSGIAVRAAESDALLGTSDAGGWLTFETQAEHLLLSAADPRWVTIHEGSLARRSTLAPVLVLAPAIDLAGRVVDGLGRTLAGASVRFELPMGFSTRFTETLEATRPQGWRTESDTLGAFALARVPAVAGSRLRAVLAGYEMDEIDAPTSSLHDLELVLFRPKLPFAGVLRGRVLAPSGAPVEGARVGLGLASVVSDARGDFEIRLARAVTTDVLTAVAPGYLPARLERPAEPSDDESGWPDDVVLVLAGPALALRGIVVDAAAEPVPGARVWLHDPTPGAPIGRVPTFLEPLMAGAPVPAGALESQARLPEEDGDAFTDEWTNAREPSAVWNWTTSDATGHFELAGLDARRYKLDVLRPGSLEIVTSEAFEAGTKSAVVRLGPPDVFERVAGRVVGPRGAPVAGAEVSLYRPLVDVRGRVFGGTAQVVVVEYAGRVTTDAQGAFAFEDVPRSGAQVSVRADGIVPTKADITAETVELVVEARCYLEVALRPPLERFDALAVADADGQPLDVMVLTEGSMNAWTDVPLVDGRSGVVSVSSRARRLKLLKDGAVVETLPIDLVPGEVNRFEP